MTILLEKLYNGNIKKTFLSQFPPNTQQTYIRIFLHSVLLENQYDKDLYSFELNEIETLLHMLEPLTIAVSKHNCMIVSSYLKWAVDKGYTLRDADILSGRDSKWFKQFKSDENVYMSEREIQNVSRGCFNYQDKVIIQLLFEGVQGNSCSEIRNLKKTDVDYQSGVLTLTDGMGISRMWKVSETAINFIKGANEEIDYLKSNGDVSPTLKSSRSLLQDTEYVVRASNTALNQQSTAVDKYVIYRRLSNIATQFGKPYFNAKNIYRSGMIKFANDIMNRDNELGDKQIKEIAEKYQIKTWWSLKDFITIDIINEFYNK